MKLFLDEEIIMLFLCHSTVRRCNALTVSRIIAFYCHHKQIKICDTMLVANLLPTEHLAIMNMN